MSVDRMTEDELISAYVDGQLSGPERAVFETRVQTDAALRRRVAATQLLYREARQLPNAAAPRNFILPRDFGQKQPVAQPKHSLLPTWVFRIGSAAAALLFVSVLAVEVARPAAFSPASLPYDAQSPAQAPAPAPAAPMADMARDTLEATVTLGAVADGATTNVQPMAATVALPTLDIAQAQTKTEPGASVLSASEANSANGAAAESAAAPEALLLTATPAPAPTMPDALDDQTVATPEPAPVTAAPQEQPEPLITPLRALAVLALVAAVVLGALGWLRK